MGYIYASIAVYGVLATKEGWNPFDPLVWYLPFIILYNFSASVLHYHGYYRLENQSEVSLIGFVAIISAVVCFQFWKGLIGGGRSPTRMDDTSFNNLSVIISFCGVLFLAILYMAYVYSLGVRSKPEMIRSGVVNLAVIYGVFNTFSLLQCVRSVRSRGRLPVVSVVITFSTFAGALLLLGQRDFVFRYVIGLLAILYGFHIVEKRHVYVSGLVMTAMIPILGIVKAVALSGELSGLPNNVAVSILSGEFRSAGRNMDTLISRASEWDYQYGATIIVDVLRGIVPAPVYRFENPTNWFRNELHPELAERGMGPGFTLAGEGFINFGYLGVCIWFALISLAVTFLYHNRHKSEFHYITYISSIPIFIYALRADLANIISPMVKHVVVPLFMLAGLAWFMNRLSHRIQ